MDFDGPRRETRIAFGRRICLGRGEPARPLGERDEAQPAAAFLAMNRPAERRAMRTALPAVAEIAEIVSRACCRYPFAVVDHADCGQAAKVVPLEHHLDLGCVRVQRIPDQFRQRANRIPGRGVALEKVLFGVEIERCQSDRAPCCVSLARDCTECENAARTWAARRRGSRARAFDLFCDRVHAMARSPRVW